MKIKANDIEKLTVAIKEAEGRATARTITPMTIKYVVGEVERKLGIAKKDMNGVRVHYTGAQQFPNAYRYSPDSTHFEMANVRGTWYVTKIYRLNCPNRRKNIEMEIPEDVRKAIVEAISFCEI